MGQHDSSSADLSKVKIGDAVTVHGTVRTLGPSTLCVQFGRYEDDQILQLAPKEIATHTPKALTAGDRVWGCATKCGGVVRHTIKDLAWVEFEDGRHEIVLPGQVERA